MSRRRRHRCAGEKAFVAGADIGEFAERTPLEQRAMEGRRVFDEVAERSRNRRSR
jgi:enoyl-CoA hydratase/carnithine racemase